MQKYKPGMAQDLQLRVGGEKKGRGSVLFKLVYL